MHSFQSESINQVWTHHFAQYVADFHVKVFQIINYFIFFLVPFVSVAVAPTTLDNSTPVVGSTPVVHSPTVQDITSELRCIYCHNALQIHVKYHVTCATHCVFFALLVPFLITLALFYIALESEYVFMLWVWLGKWHFDKQLISLDSIITFSCVPFTLIFYSIEKCRTPRKYCSFCNHRLWDSVY